MIDSMKLMFNESFETLTKAPRLYIGGADHEDMDESEDQPPTLTGTRNRQIDEDETLKDASEAKKAKTRNQHRNQKNLEQIERPTPSSKSTNG